MRKGTALKPANNNSLIHGTIVKTHFDVVNIGHIPNLEFYCITRQSITNQRHHLSRLSNIETSETERRAYTIHSHSQTHTRRRKEPATGELIFISFLSMVCWYWTRLMWRGAASGGDGTVTALSQSLLNFRSCLVSFYPHTIQANACTHVSHVIQNESIRTINFRGE